MRRRWRLFGRFRGEYPAHDQRRNGALEPIRCRGFIERLLVYWRPRNRTVAIHRTNTSVRERSVASVALTTHSSITRPHRGNSPLRDPAASIRHFAGLLTAGDSWRSTTVRGRTSDRSVEHGRFGNHAELARRYRFLANWTMGAGAFRSGFRPSGRYGPDRTDELGFLTRLIDIVGRSVRSGRREPPSPSTGGC